LASKISCFGRRWKKVEPCFLLSSSLSLKIPLPTVLSLSHSSLCAVSLQERGFVDLPNYSQLYVIYRINDSVTGDILVTKIIVYALTSANKLTKKYCAVAPCMIQWFFSPVSSATITKHDDTIDIGGDGSVKSAPASIACHYS
jgi:hypothetical protein